MKRHLRWKLFVAFILTTALLNGCMKEDAKNTFVKDVSKNGNIPYLPLSLDNILCIELTGHNLNKNNTNSSNTRLATPEEIAQIVGWLNNIKKYDLVMKIPKRVGPPAPNNISLFSKDYDETDYDSFMYILEEGKNSISINIPKTNVRYIVKLPEINKLLKQLLQ